MRSRLQDAAPAARKSLASLAKEIAALDLLTVSQLAEKYLEVFGEPRRTHNKAYLRKQIAWRLQEREEGGLSDRALDRIAQLAPQAPARWQRAAGAVQRHAPKGATRTPSPAARTPNAAPRSSKDPRLPTVGTVLTRLYRGVEHRVTVRANDFEYHGRAYPSLSAIARLITGTSWNGFRFFLANDSSGGGGAR